MAKEKDYIVTTSSLNIRSGPGTDYEIEGTVAHGEQIISPDTKGWVPILLEDDSIGWVAEKYLQEAPEEQPTAEEPEKPAPKVSQIGLPIFQRKLPDLYGTPNYKQFARKYLINIGLEEFADFLGHVRTFDGKAFTSIYAHNLLEGPLKMALRLVCKRGLARELKTYDGCFNIRPMKSGGSFSVHSWGLALDFNQATNPFHTKNSRTWPDLVSDFSDDFIGCFLKAGFEWGGLWTSVHDAMHFQLPWTKDWRKSSESLKPVVYPKEASEAGEHKPERLSPVSGEFDFTTREGTIAAIKAECQRQGIGLPAQIAYVLATTDWETGHTFEPVREAYQKDDSWRRRNLRYYPYYGRGYVQLTWEDNYRKYAKILGLDLVKNPDLALDPKIALFILVHGFRTGAFTGKKIADYIDAEEKDFYHARRCINRLDRAEEIAALAEKFMDV
jgi:D-alanyl-D-alanine carboxypeptidase/Bacterial SH3 domain/Chitinase class I